MLLLGCWIIRNGQSWLGDTARGNDDGREVSKWAKTEGIKNGVLQLASAFQWKRRSYVTSVTAVRFKEIKPTIWRLQRKR